MSTAVQVQYRRGTSAQVAAFTGAQGEMVVDTTNQRVVVQDGSTQGGWPQDLAVRTAVANTNYTTLATDRIVAFTSLSPARTVSLIASASYPVGTQLWIVDESGSCSTTNTITISPNGTDTINGANSSISIVIPYGFAVLESSGTGKWTIVSQALAAGERTAVSDANYSALTTDRNICYTAITAARTVTLPAAASYPVGIKLTVIDQSGSVSGTNTITVSRAGSDTINGGTSATIKTAYGFVELESNGSNGWTILDASSIIAGTIDNAVIGGTTPAAGSFTTLSASSTVSGSGFSNYLASPPAIGGTTPAAASFTALGVGESAPSAGNVNISGQYQVGGSQIAAGNLAAISNKTVLGNNSGSSAAPSALSQANLQGLVAPLTIVAAIATGVNLNATGDTALTVTLPTGYTRYVVNSIRISNASASLTSAKVGLYTAASQGGTAIISQTTLTVSSASDGTSNNTQAINPTLSNASFTVASYGTLYFNVGTAEGSAATATVSLTIQIVP